MNTVFNNALLSHAKWLSMLYAVIQELVWLGKNLLTAWELLLKVELQSS